MRDVTSLIAERRGVTALIFALAALPIVSFFAFTVDYGIQSRTTAALAEAADSAALAGTQATANVYQTNGYNFEAARQVGVQAAATWFNAELSMSGFKPSPPPVVLPANITLSSDKTQILTKMQYSMQSPSFFAKLLKINNYNITGNSSSVYTLPGYLDIHIMMDTSPSMGIVADPSNWEPYTSYMKNTYLTTDIYGAQMQQMQCVFACHMTGHNSDLSQPNGSDTYYAAEDYAKKYGISNLLRIDVVGSAVKQLLQNVSNSPQSDHYRVGLYQFNDDASVMYPLGHDMKTAGSIVAGLMPIAAANNEFHTDLTKSMGTMLQLLPKAGDGLSAVTPRETLFMITDGFTDIRDTPGGPERVGVIDPASCAALKAKGVDIYVLYTQYYDIYDPLGSNTYQTVFFQQVSSYLHPVDKITASLQSCSSGPQYFYSASDSTSIRTALAQMLNAALSTPTRFTQ